MLTSYVFYSRIHHLWKKCPQHPESHWHAAMFVVLSSLVQSGKTQTLWADISSSHTEEFGEPPPPRLEHSIALALGLCILAKHIQTVITDLQ